jgi:hypothetical protein
MAAAMVAAMVAAADMAAAAAPAEMAAAAAAAAVAAKIPSFSSRVSRTLRTTARSKTPLNSMAVSRNAGSQPTGKTVSFNTYVARNPEKKQKKPENPLSSLYLLILSFSLLLYHNRFQPRLWFHHIRRRQGC